MTVTTPCPACGSTSQNWHPESHACYDCDYGVIGTPTPLHLVMSMRLFQRTREELKTQHGMTDDEIVECERVIDEFEEANPIPHPIPDPPPGFIWSADNYPTFRPQGMDVQSKAPTMPVTLGNYGDE